jgi:hypothetical protein
MEVKLYKIVEVYDSEEQRWKLAEIGGKYVYECSTTMKRACPDLDEVDEYELSKELREKILNKEEVLLHKGRTFYWYNVSLMQAVKDDFAECGRYGTIGLSDFNIRFSKWRDMDNEIREVKDIVQYYSTPYCEVPYRVIVFFKGN